MNRQLLIPIFILFSGCIASVHAETNSSPDSQTANVLEQAANSTEEWVGKTSEQLELPQKYDAARNSIDKATEQIKTSLNKTSEDLQLQQKYDSVKNTVGTAVDNAKNTWNAPENKAARAETEDQLKDSWSGIVLQGKKLWQSVVSSPEKSDLEQPNNTLTMPVKSETTSPKDQQPTTKNTSSESAQ